mgnify:CR=1 FL=1
MKINTNLLIFSISLLQLSCSDFNKMAPLLECESNEELNVICEFTNPEDIVVTPDNNFLIVSEYGGQKPIQKEKPVIFGVLTTNNLNQALERCGGKHGDKGLESSQSLLQIISSCKD